LILMEDLEMRDLCQDCAKTAHSWAKVAKKTMLHWLKSLTGKGYVLGEGHHRWSGERGKDYSQIDNVAQRLEGRRLLGGFNQWKQRWDKTDFMNLVHKLSE
jgi:hypothetical protein